MLLFVTNDDILYLTRKRGDQMKYIELFKHFEGGNLMVAGHLSNEEVKEYFRNGYKKQPVRKENKNGIRRV